MRVKLDENLPSAATEVMVAHGHDAETVVGEGLGGADDVAVAMAAHRENRVLITLDQDFADIRAYPPGAHPGIIVLRLDTPKRSLIKAALTALLGNYDLDDLSGCVAIVQLGAVRIRRPIPEPGAEERDGDG